MPKNENPSKSWEDTCIKHRGACMVDFETAPQKPSGQKTPKKPNELQEAVRRVSQETIIPKTPWGMGLYSLPKIK